MDQPRKLAKPVRGQLNRENKCLCRCIRGKYIYINCCLLLLIYQVYFLFGDMCIRARFTAVYAGTFNMPTSYQEWGWEREAYINWSMVICQGRTRSELP